MVKRSFASMFIKQIWCCKRCLTKVNDLLAIGLLYLGKQGMRTDSAKQGDDEIRLGEGELLLLGSNQVNVLSLKVFSKLDNVLSLNKIIINSGM